MSMADSPAPVIDVLRSWLSPRLDPGAQAWLSERCRAAASGDKKALFLAFGTTPRKIGKDDLQLTAEELAAAERARPSMPNSGQTSSAFHCDVVLLRMRPRWGLQSSAALELANWTRSPTPLAASSGLTVYSNRKRKAAAFMTSDLSYIRPSIKP